MRIFLDANVLFSAAKSDGAVRQLLTLLPQSGHESWADGFVIEEARRNLASKAPEGLIVLDDLLSRVRIAAVQVRPEVPDLAIALPEKDRPVLAAAIALGCSGLVTGDRTHFGRFYGTTLGGVRVYSPASLGTSRECKVQSAK